MNKEQFKEAIEEIFDNSIIDLCDECRGNYGYDDTLSSDLEKIYDKVKES